MLLRMMLMRKTVYVNVMDVIGHLLLLLVDRDMHRASGKECNH